MKIFDNFFDPGGGLDMIARYGHIIVGITWIGLLYFFNFVQTPSYAQLDAGSRNQQVVIASVRQQLAGGQADPAQPDAAKRGARASRANTFFSITMLWFMVFAAHYAGVFGDPIKTNNAGIYWLIVLVLWAFVE